MDKKGDTSILDTIIGALIGLAAAVAVISVVTFVFKVGTPEQDSLKVLAEKVIEVNKDKPGATGLAVFYQGENSFFYPITEETRNQPFQRKGSKLFSQELDFVFSHTKVNPDCETENCLCLCQEFDQEFTKRCVQGKLFCQQLPRVHLSPRTSHLVTRLEEGGIAAYELGLLAGAKVTPGIGPILSTAVEVFVLEDSEPAPAEQSVKVIKCRGIEGEPYCKDSRPGDISIIFHWLDQKGVYNSIK